MKHLFFTLLLAMLGGHAYSQNILKGTISDTEENRSLFGVDVYFPQLEKGTISDENGAFKLSGLPTGNYKLIISSIGFQTYSKTIAIEEGVNILEVFLFPSAIEMEEVIVSTPFHKLQRENVMKVERANIDELKTKGAITLADGITNIPGVESLSTGVGIGKPVIRGLSSNRVLVYTQGVRLENQQFGGEHGLGVSDAGIESVEVIKGPASLLYGSDALGGVLYLNPEKFAVAGDTEGDINFNYFSNTLGLSTNAGIKTSGNRFKFIGRGSIVSHADYHTGHDISVTNSRFREYDFKTGIGYQATSFKTELRYNYNDLNLGLPEEIGERTNNRIPDDPHQSVANHVLSSKTNLFFKKSSLETTLGYTFNIRKEFEEGEEAPALHMDLSTLNYNLQYHLPKWGNLETIVGVQGMHQVNTNFGEEVLIPDATTNDIGVLGTSHVHFKNESDLQFGLRYDRRAIDSKENGVINGEGYMPELNRSFGSFNAALGYKRTVFKNVTGRINLASGFRAPNLAELTSNGVHEGTNRYEIGNQNLTNEQNFQTDLSLEYTNEHVELYVNAFHNKISDYIFIEPNGERIDNEEVFLYLQQDARLYGGEIGLHIHPHPLDWLHIESSFETVTGKLKNGAFLPLIPANSITNTLRTEFVKLSKRLISGYTFITLKSVFTQNNTSMFETTTNGYSLLQAGLGGKFLVIGQPIDMRINGSNLLNQNYVSHLSRLKGEGIANIGRNVNLSIHILL